MANNSSPNNPYLGASSFRSNLGLHNNIRFQEDYNNKCLVVPIELPKPDPAGSITLDLVTFFAANPDTVSLIIGAIRQADYSKILRLLPACTTVNLVDLQQWLMEYLLHKTQETNDVL